jgi:hypothetical protein
MAAHAAKRKIGLGHADRADGSGRFLRSFRLWDGIEFPEHILCRFGIEAPDYMNSSFLPSANQSAFLLLVVVALKINAMDSGGIV